MEINTCKASKPSIQNHPKAALLCTRDLVKLEELSSEREDVRLRVSILIGTQVTGVGHTVNELALGAEVRVGDQVEGEEASNQHCNEQGKADQ